MTSKYDIQQAFNSNIVDHQIGTTDGMSPTVAEDLGFTTSAEDIRKLQGLLEDSVQVEPVAEDLLETSEDSEPVVCGDCGQVMPCAHGDGRRTFGY